MKREGEDTGNIPYQEAVGCLLYLVQGTRPDIAFAVGNVSRFNSNHGHAHWTAVKRIFRYLKGTINYSILFSRSNNLELHGFADADWGSDVDTRRSCTGYVFMMGTSSISWLSKRQPTISLSSTEAEYMAMAMATQEVVWLKQFYEQFEKVEAVRLECDNQSALNIAATDYFRARTKHINTRHHYVREKAADGTIELLHVPTAENVADCLTKGVTGQKQKWCAQHMGLLNIASYRVGQDS